MKSLLLILTVLISTIPTIFILCSNPSDPVENPDNTSVQLLIKNNPQKIPFGSTQKIGISLLLPQHIEKLHIWTDNLELDSTFHCELTDYRDTIYLEHQFRKEGVNTIFVEGTLIDKNLQNRTDSISIIVLPEPVRITFDTIRGSFQTCTETVDSMLFTIKTNSKYSIDFSVKSIPQVDPSDLKLVQNKDSVLVLFSPDQSKTYTLWLFAQSDTVKDSIQVPVTVYEKFTFQKSHFPDTIRIGDSDTITLITPSDRKDTLSCKFLNEKAFPSEELTILVNKPDSLILLFTPDSAGTFEFIVSLSNDHLIDTLHFTIPVIEKIPVWNKSVQTAAAKEGKELVFDFGPLLSDSKKDAITFAADFGIITGTIWKWTPPWGCDTSETCVIKATRDNKEFTLNLKLSIEKGDTTPPVIRILNSEMNDKIIGSSQIVIEAVASDSQSGVSSVLFINGPVSSKGALRNDSIYFGAITGLVSGVRTEIKIQANDNSIKHSSSTYSFFLTYDSTLGDDIPPVIVQKSGPENRSRVKKADDTLVFSITDDSNLDSVYWTLNGHFSEALISKDNNEFILPLKLTSFDTNFIMVHAIDNSVNRNHDSVSIMLDYNTPISDVILKSPADGETNVDTNATLEWTGGEDADGDPVHLQMFFGKTKEEVRLFPKLIQATVKSPFKITLAPNTAYSWQVIAYSKTYPDTVKSEIFSFKTRPRRIIIIPTELP